MEDSKLFIDVIAVIISFIALICSGVCVFINRINALSEYRSEILNWYNRCISVIMYLKHCSLEVNEKNRLLGELSGLIEQGRFFFPNIDKGDNFGKNKTAAYKGFRSHILEYLVLYYNLFNNTKEAKKESVESLQKKFTSAVYGYLKPWKFIQKFERTLMANHEKNFSIEDEENFVL